MWYTAFPTMKGPATDHFRRSDEWNRNPPFFVPTATTTLPFLIVRGMSPTCDAGKDVNGVPGFELCLREGTHDDFLVDEDIYVRPASAGLVLTVRVGAQRGRDPDENARARNRIRRHLGNHGPSPATESSAG